MNRIKELRTARKLTQPELAAMLNSSRQAVGKWENGDIDMNTDTIGKLCTVFQCTADYLLGLSSQIRPEISDDDAVLLSAYKMAPDSVRAGIDTLLEPYKAKKEEEGL